jgi:hypothetical protein
MKYAAYLETNGTTTRIMPRAKNNVTALFTTLKAAQNRLSRIRLKQDGRGVVYTINTNGEREYCWSIAL